MTGDDACNRGGRCLRGVEFLFMSRAVARALLVGVLAGVTAMPHAATATVTGVVKDHSGAVIPFTSVDLYSAQHEEDMVADGAGEFRFSEVPPGRYDLDVRAAIGFCDQPVRGVEIGSSNPRPLTVTMRIMAIGTPVEVQGAQRPAPNAGAKWRNLAADCCVRCFQRVELANPSGKSGVRGVITFSSSREETADDGTKLRYRVFSPLADAVISILKYGFARPLAPVRTDHEGVFVFPQLQPGLYALRVSKKGYADTKASDLRARPRMMLRVELSTPRLGASGCP
jgi:hypothetical protein